jgi:hypothetical protein
MNGARSFRAGVVFSLLGAAILVGGRGPTARAGAVAAQPVAGQVFAVHFTLGGPDATCDPGSGIGQAFAMAIYQFAFTSAGSVLTLAISQSGLTEPTVLDAHDEPVRTVNGDLVVAAISGSGSARSGTPHFTNLHMQATGSGAAPDRLTVSQATLTLTVVTGDLVVQCEATATGAGTRDTTPPTAFFSRDGCFDRASSTRQPCALLADSGVGVWFSEIVALSGIDQQLSAVDGDGNPVALYPTHAPSAFGSGVTLRGAWPLGGTVTIHVAAGVQDRAGNASAATAQAFAVVPDPGDLDDAGNSGFETGDWTGYQVNHWADYWQPTPDRLVDEAGFNAATAGEPPQAAVVSTLHGVTPSGGTAMAALGSLSGCGSNEVTLTARFTVPSGVAQLVLDYDVVVPRYPTEPGTLIAASLRGARGLTTAQLRWPGAAEFTPLDEQTQHTDWRHFALPVDMLAGQTVVLTLRTRGETMIGPPPLCSPGLLLLDNLHFEEGESSARMLRTAAGTSEATNGGRGPVEPVAPTGRHPDVCSRGVV